MSLEYVYHAGRLAVERGTAGPRSERTSEARDCTNSPGLRFALRVEGQGKTPFPEFSTREATLAEHAVQERVAEAPLRVEVPRQRRERPELRVDLV